jgi:hypothetical protein
MNGNIQSPDRRKTLTVTPIRETSNYPNGQLMFSITARNRSYSSRLAGFDAEITWSPDSSAFAVTQTEGGGGFGYRVYVFYVDSSGLHKLAVSSPIEKVFGTPTKCEVPVLPNTGFVTWLGGSKRALIAAEVVPVSTCQCSGMFRAYEVQLPDLKIIKTYDQALAKEKFADKLGCELRDAKSCPIAKSIQ